MPGEPINRHSFRTLNAPFKFRFAAEGCGLRLELQDRHDSVEEPEELEEFAGRPRVQALGAWGLWFMALGLGFRMTGSTHS